MKAFLLIAHGSRVEASNEEVRRLAARLKNSVRDRFDMVKYAFLELAEPSIPEGVQQCIDAGAEEVFVVPYFLAAGRHVREDIPSELRKKRAEYPAVEIHLCDYLGKSPALAGLLVELADQGGA